MKRIKNSLCLFMAALALGSCNKSEKTETTTTVKDSVATAVVKSDYATMSDGTKIEKYTLENAKGMKMEVITFGGIITSLTAPDKNGKFEDIALGFTKAEDYFNGNPYFFGAIIGRYGNRIKEGKFNLDGKDYQLTVNDGPNSLHGGKGFDKRVWTAEIPDANQPSIKLSYTSKDGEEGYPGNLQVSVVYTLTDDNALEITYDANTDKKTIINLTQHSYFNLAGTFETIEDHVLELKADKMIPVDATLIPTGELKPVKGTAFDFTTPKVIGKDIAANDEQLKKGQGYDHCWVFTDASKDVREVGSLYHPASGRFMQVYTDQPSVQFYSGNFLDGTKDNKNGKKYEKRSGLCLETQHYPDSPNQKAFPTTVLNPGEKYHTKTVYKFSTK